jgi:flagellar hook-associated protein 3 FlgL
MTDLLGIAPGPLTPTPQVEAQQLVGAITANQAQQATLEQQISSGTVVSQPSDNPTLAAQVITLNASLTRAQQYVANANDGEGWLEQGTATVNQVLQTLQSVEQAVESVSGEALSGQQAAITGIATQVANSLQELLGLANTTYNGQAIFAGTGGSGGPTVAYDANGNYVGTSTVPSRTVAPGVQVPIAVTGPSIFGSSTSATGLLGTGAGGTAVGVLQQIVNDLNSGNLTAATTTDLNHLQSAMQTVEGAAAQLGAYYQNMQAFTAQATATQQALQTEVGNAQDTNIPEATTQLTEAQQAYQEALWATAQTEQVSLVQFLS